MNQNDSNKINQAWKATLEKIAWSATPTEALDLILLTYQEQYGEETTSTIVDQGVLLIEGLISANKDQENRSSSQIVSMYIDPAQKILSQTGSNSVFAQLALKAGVLALAQRKNKLLNFRVAFLTKFLDMFISDNIANIIGHPNLVNPLSVENYLDQANRDYWKIAKTGNSLTEVIAKRLKTITR